MAAEVPWFPGFEPLSFVGDGHWPFNVPGAIAGRAVIRASRGSVTLLRDVDIRLARTTDERRRWDALAARHHYLPFSGLFGKALRHVAVHDGTWLALVGWQAGAFKVGVRDSWIGWSPAQQFSRLHLIAHNARYVLLQEERPANLASRVLSVSLRRLSGDMQAVHGFPVYLAESFVDPSRFRGTCYRASNWQSLGFTRGFAREPGGAARWRHHGQPKEVFVHALTKDARAALCADAVAGPGRGDSPASLPDADAFASLHGFLADMEDFRKPRGQRYSLAFYFTVMIAARLCGYRGVTAFGQFARLLDQDRLEAAGAFWSPSRQCYTAPGPSTFHYILSSMPPDTLDRALGAWARGRSGGTAAVALDGKDVRGASRQLDGERRIMVAAVEHRDGLVLGQTQVPDKTNEIPAVRQLVSGLDIRGRAVTVDAMHVQQKTARCILDCGADYVMTAVKDNQPTLLDDLAAIDWSEARHAPGEPEKAHGRLEKRDCDLIDISDAAWDGTCDLYGRRQAFRITRCREEIKTGTRSIETALGLTSLAAGQAAPRDIADLVRRHWEIENRLHYPRDFSYDEDRCRARVRHLPRNLAALSNVAISLIRLDARFEHLPEAHRYFAARSNEALDAVLN